MAKFNLLWYWLPTLHHQKFSFWWFYCSLAPLIEVFDANFVHVNVQKLRPTILNSLNQNTTVNEWLQADKLMRWKDFLLQIIDLLMESQNIAQNRKSLKLRFWSPPRDAELITDIESRLSRQIPRYFRCRLSSSIFRYLLIFKIFD